MEVINSQAIWESCSNGMALALFISPVVNACNRVSVVCCEQGISTRTAISRIYRGKGPGECIPARSSLKNFGVGWDLYIGRELPRCLFKSLGAQMLLPSLERHYHADTEIDGKFRANMVFAGAMASADILMAPIDGMRVRKQVGKSAIPTSEEAKGKNRLFMLCQGSGANTVRQFLMWSLWAGTEKGSKRLTEHVLGLDPDAIPGFATRSLLQAVPISGISYPFERVKNYLQINPYHGKHRYFVAVSQIVKEQGAIGLFRGIVPRMGAAWCLAMGFNYLVDQGRKKEV